MGSKNVDKTSMVHCMRTRRVGRGKKCVVASISTSVPTGSLIHMGGMGGRGGNG